MKTTRPEASQVAIWDDLDKLAADYGALRIRCRTWCSHVVDVKFIERTREQLIATRDQISEGSIEQATAIAVMQAAERLFPLARDLIKARSLNVSTPFDPDQPIPFTLVHRDATVGGDL